MKAKALLSLALPLLASLAQAATLPAAFPESKFSALGIPTLPQGQYEASGVHYQNGYLYVVFDNSYRIVRANTALTSFAIFASLVSPDAPSQFEGITFDARGTTHFYVPTEVSSTGKVNEFNATFSSRQVQPISGAATFSNTNAGYEGLAWVWHCSPSDPNGDDYLLALCEGNGCGGSSSGGRVHVLRQHSSTTPTSWAAIPGSPIAVPPSFDDYADIALAPAYPATCDCAGVCSNATGVYKVAIVSQESSKLWIGTLNTTNWTFGSGTTYDFPVDGDGNEYCNVEGVTFLSNNKIAVVSDARNPQIQGSECVAKEQTISIFTLP